MTNPDGITRKYFKNILIEADRNGNISANINGYDTIAVDMSGSSSDDLGEGSDRTATIGSYSPDSIKVLTFGFISSLLTSTQKDILINNGMAHLLATYPSFKSSPNTIFIPFNENIGNIAYDASGNNIDITVPSDAKWLNPANALYYDHITDVLTNPHNITKSTL